MFYLDFEKKLQPLFDDYELLKISGDEEAILKAEENIKEQSRKVYSNLTDYQKLQLARHQDRPYALDYIRLIMDEKLELHGDRHFKDDNAIICYVGSIGSKKCVVIGEQKGRGTKNKIRRNFGMPHPEGYRKALRVAKLAEKFNLPILMLVDTPGAYPGIGAEERNQSEAIAKNLFELSDLKVPTVSIVIGEGGSGGALAIGVADKLACLEYSVFSVISPEGCAAILWNDPSKVETASSVMKIDAASLKRFGLIDDVIPEPFACAHRNKQEAAQLIKDYFLQSVADLEAMSLEDRLQKRYSKLISLGQFKEE